MISLLVSCGDHGHMFTYNDGLFPEVCMADFRFTSVASVMGTAKAKIKVPSATTPKLPKVLSFGPAVDQLFGLEFFSVWVWSRSAFGPGVGQLLGLG